MGLRVRIHRGAAQVGGTCVELESGGQRLLLDLGMPLDAGEGEVPLPAVPGLLEGDPSLLGVVVSHLHGDHCGLVPFVQPGLPLAMGPIAHRILREAEFFTGRPPLPELRWSLRDREPIQIGPFRITPHQVDHSALDAFALLVDAGGRRLFYTGDLRAHGNDRRPFERLLREPPDGVHAMLMEGTQIGEGRDGGEGPAECDLRRVLTRRFREHPGLVLVSWSSQNLDRLRTVYEAAREAGRALVLDLYTVALATVAGAENVPRLGDPALFVCLRERERRAVKAAGVGRTEFVCRWRIFREQLVERGRELVVMLRPSTIDELERTGALRGALAIWSMWNGYLDGPSEKRMAVRLSQANVPLEVRHVSGHAYVSDLRRLVNAVRPERVIPIHTSRPERFVDVCERVQLRSDGESWSA